LLVGWGCITSYGVQSQVMLYRPINDTIYKTTATEC